MGRASGGQEARARAALLLMQWLGLLAALAQWLQTQRAWRQWGVKQTLGLIGQNLVLTMAVDERSGCGGSP
jgi:hypothetical protein